MRKSNCRKTQIMNDEELRKSRRLTHVPRWCVVPTLRPQKVDQHVYQSTQIARWLLQGHDRGHDPLFVLEVIECVLDHDNDEARTGDTPTPAKAYNAYPEDSNQLKVVCKCADILEAICFLEEELAMGNVVYTKAVLLERKAVFHDWWQCFNWSANKPMSSDVIRKLVGQFVRPIHPAMEAQGVVK